MLHNVSHLLPLDRTASLADASSLRRQVRLVVLRERESCAPAAEHRAAVTAVGDDDAVRKDHADVGRAADAVRVSSPALGGDAAAGEGTEHLAGSGFPEHVVHAVEGLSKRRADVLVRPLVDFIRQVALAETSDLLATVPIEDGKARGKVPVFQVHSEVRVLHSVAPALHGTVAPFEAPRRVAAVARLLGRNRLRQHLSHEACSSCI
mmetsp:Transcript_11733/g.26186  ORF Transcript_11733/g.26186 Transcript_11733/m.26186 type:complete len:207 (-) Transcript_11733:102-722(-)